MSSYSPLLQKKLKRAYNALKKKKRKFNKDKYLISQAKRMDNNPTKPELIFIQIMDELDVRYETQKIIGGKIYDFYVPEKNIIFEIDGNYWHGVGLQESEKNNIQKRTSINDKKKDIIAKGFNYDIVRITEGDLEKNYDVVKEQIKKLIF